ncbi:MAG: hypothetical protein ABFS56_04470 [Pseudomonadota bacterium]
MKILAIPSSIILLLLCVIFFLKPDYVFQIASFRPLKTPSVKELDQPSKKGNPLAGPFFDERNTLEVEVPRNMSLGDFLDLYQLNMPHVRRQIAQQIGKASIPNQHRLSTGERFTIDLTPPEDAAQ